MLQHTNDSEQPQNYGKRQGPRAQSTEKKNRPHEMAPKLHIHINGQNYIGKHCFGNIK